MTPSLVASPGTVDLVPANEVWEIITAADRELASLERRAREAAREADEAEQRAREAGIDGCASRWAMVRLQWFLDDLRSEADDQVDRLRDVARQRARRRIDEAEEEASRVRATACRTPESALESGLTLAAPPMYGSAVTDADPAAALAPGEPRADATIANQTALAREFWPAEKPPRRWSLRRISLSVLLELMLVVLALVFIFLRLS